MKFLMIVAVVLGLSSPVLASTWERSESRIRKQENHNDRLREYVNNDTSASSLVGIMCALSLSDWMVTNSSNYKKMDASQQARYLNAHRETRRLCDQY